MTATVVGISLITLVIMAIQHSIWRVSAESPQALPTARLDSEQLLEDMITKDPRILSGEWMLIGRQEVTSFGGRIDLLAIAPDASLVLIELKRERTPRDIVAQAIDYATWVESLTPDKIAQIYSRFVAASAPSDASKESLSDAFKKRFGAELDEDSLNHAHQIILVASELDPSTERIISYLNARDIAINAIFFQVFQHGQEQLLSRAWLIDPSETQVNAAMTTGGKGQKEPWNGEYYVSYGNRDWEDARRHGYICGGGGTWYSQTLKLLSPGDRVWVRIPKAGFVGVGLVEESVQPVKDFQIHTEQGPRAALEVLRDAEDYRQDADNPELCEYFVRVRWLETVSEDQAFNEVGLFGNQNTVCQPTAPKWRHTIDRLKSHFKAWQPKTEAEG